MNSVRSVAATLALAACAALPCGCGPSGARVSGDVSYEGQPVEEGYISFTPADGQGRDAGAPVRNGRYAVAELPPGPKVVKVVATRKVNFASSSEEMMRRAAEARRAGNHDGLVDPADLIPDNAGGNNARVEIPAGTSTRDFHLKKPPERK